MTLKFKVGNIVILTRKLELLSSLNIGSKGIIRMIRPTSYFPYFVDFEGKGFWLSDEDFKLAD